MALTAFTTREGGFSSAPFNSLNLGTHVGDDPEVVARNRRLVDEMYGPVAYMNQTHSDVVIEVDHATVVDADAIFTRTPVVVLAVQVADCIPLLLEGEGSVAAVHVGRRGLVNEIAGKTLDAMSEESVQAFIGPSICGRCYEVGQDIYDEVVEKFPLAASRTEKGTLALDLPRALAAYLTLRGVAVDIDGRCTVEESSLFSYRRDGKTGRQAGLISL